MAVKLATHKMVLGILNLVNIEANAVASNRKATK